MKTILTGLILLVTQTAFAVQITTQQAPLQTNGTLITMTVDAGGNAPADLIFVVDDSASMAPHQHNLSNNLALVIDDLSKYGDINTAVITTSLKKSSFPVPTGTAEFVGPVLNSDDKNFMDYLKSQIMVGTTGDSMERPLEALSFALSEPNLSGANKGFLRPNADLYVFFLTDTEDQGAVTAQNLYTQLKALKPNNAIKTIAAMAQSPQCPKDVFNGTNLIDFVALTGGVTIDLCGYFDDTIPEALAEINQFSNDIQLQVFPNTEIDVKTIVVSVNGQPPIVPGDIFNGWVFNHTTNVLTLGKNILTAPKSGKVKITYELRNK